MSQALRPALESGVVQLAAGRLPDSARRDAEWLLLHCAGLSRTMLLTHPETELTAAQQADYAAMLARRAAGEPVQYITGVQEFYGLELHVAPSVLIPRPETEILVEAACALAEPYRAPRIVDVGTGSGAIALAVAHQLASAQVQATDCSAAALEVARANAERLGLKERIPFSQGDLLAPVASETFDFVLSNPPYIPLADHSELSPEVRDYEPASALFAGEDGLEVYRRLIPQAHAVLAPEGWLLMEIGFGQQEALEHLLAKEGFSGTEFLPDLQGIARVARARRP